MAKTTSLGFTDTAVEGVSSLAFPRAVLNLETDFRVKASQPGKEVTLTNITSPIDQPERIRIAYADVNNIYGGSGIEPSLFAPTKRGVSILAQLTEVLSVTDTVDSTFRVDYPVSYHVVIKAPSASYITGPVIQAGLGRLLSCLYDTGSLTTGRLEAILRGSLLPSEM